MKSADETSYSRIDHLGKIILIFDAVNNTWISKDSQQIIIHPLLASSTFDELLLSYADNINNIWNIEATSAVEIFAHAKRLVCNRVMYSHALS